MLFLRGGCQIEFVWGPSWRSWFSEAGKIHGTSVQCVASLVWIGTELYRSEGNLSGYISCLSQKFCCKSLTRPFKEFSLLMSLILKSLQTLFMEGQKQPEVVLCTCHCSVQCASNPTRNLPDHNKIETGSTL